MLAVCLSREYTERPQLTSSGQPIAFVSNVAPVLVATPQVAAEVAHHPLLAADAASLLRLLLGGAPLGLSQLLEAQQACRHMEDFAVRAALGHTRSWARRVLGRPIAARLDALRAEELGRAFAMGRVLLRFRRADIERRFQQQWFAGVGPAELLGPLFTLPAAYALSLQARAR